MTIVAALARACRRGDADELGALLATDVVASIDLAGGGSARLSGVEQVTTRILRTCGPAAGVEVALGEANARPALVLRRDGLVAGVIGIEVSASLISEVWLLLNPDKLRLWNPS